MNSVKFSLLLFCIYRLYLGESEAEICSVWGKTMGKCNFMLTAGWDEHYKCYLDLWSNESIPSWRNKNSVTVLCIDCHKSNAAHAFRECNKYPVSCAAQQQLMLVWLSYMCGLYDCVQNNILNKEHIFFH